MKVAAIAVTYNDGYKLNEWFSYYNDYKDEISKFIIIDNCSENEYINQLEELFTEAIILKRKENGGSTKAYNDGIRFALLDKDIDSILLIGNDVKMEIGGITKLYTFLKSSIDYGMVAPAILKRDSNKIESVGCNISSFLYLKEPYVGEDIYETKFVRGEFNTVAGGMNMATREFYENVGLQDEKLFMYSDEVDMGLRAKKNGFKLAVTKEVLSWHQHINPSQRSIRLPYSGYLIGRNKVYLGYKHFGFCKAIFVFMFQVFIFLGGVISNIRRIHMIKYHLYFFLGALAGLFKITKNFTFIISNK